MIINDSREDREQEREKERKRERVVRGIKA